MPIPTPDPAAALPLVVCMGVSGCGKSTIGLALAELLGVPFQDADSFHSPENIRKMSAGVALQDADRWQWLARCKSWLDQHAVAGAGGVLACSALKRRYREALGAGAGPLRVVHIRLDPSVNAERINGRHGHFMQASLLASQLEDLEVPSYEEDAVSVSNIGTPGDVARRAAHLLAVAPSSVSAFTRRPD